MLVYQPRHASEISRQETAGRSCGGSPQSLRSVDSCKSPTAPGAFTCGAPELAPPGHSTPSLLT
ncbi:hypothetical protein J6590_100011, partial [Homalodisca vitripennis]